MSKINSLILAPCEATKIAIKAAFETIHGAKPQLDKVAVSELEGARKSVLDLSTEELGFFKHNGKIVDIVFPR